MWYISQTINYKILLQNYVIRGSKSWQLLSIDTYKIFISFTLHPFDLQALCDWVLSLLHHDFPVEDKIGGAFKFFFFFFSK